MSLEELLDYLIGVLENPYASIDDVRQYTNDIYELRQELSKEGKI